MSSEAKGKGKTKTKPVTCRIARRDDSADAPRMETFEVDLSEEATLHELLVAIASNPRPRNGVLVSPPAWDASCLEGSCGGCALRAGGRAVLACTTRIADVEKRRGIVVLEPMATFPIVRDLVVDHAARDLDVDAMSRVGSSPIAPSPGASARGGGAPDSSVLRAALGACIACGACLDACPEAVSSGGFVGAEAIVRNRRAHDQPQASVSEREALDAALMRPGGISECGHAENCIDVCPADVPIVEALSASSRVMSSRFLLGWLRR